MPRRFAGALTLSLLLLTASTAHATWPHDPTVNVPVSVGPNTRQREVAVGDGLGGIYIAWEDYRSGTSRIYAQHLGPDGSVFPGWAPNGNEVKTTFTSRALDTPTICSDDAGGCVIAWHEAFSVTDHDIYAQRLSPNGVQLWSASGVGVATSGYDQFAPRVVDDGAGNTLITWGEDHSADGPPTGLDLYANRLSPLGSNRWGANGIILCSATGDQYSQTVVCDGASGMDVAWVDHRANFGIFATRRDSTGALHSAWTANGNSIASGAYSFNAPAIVGNSSGGLLICWTDDRNGLNASDVFATSLSGTSFSLGVLGGIAVCTAAGFQLSPVIVSDGADGAFVAWGDGRSGPVNAYAMHLDSSGAPENGWPAQGLAVTTSGSQAPSAIVGDGVGGCIIGISGGGIRNDIFAAHLTGSGAIAEGWTAEVPTCTALADQYAPVVVSDGASGAILAWQDQRNGNSYDLYAQNVDRWGALGVAAPTIVSVTDVPNDQGGKVTVRWNASYLDAYPNYAIGSYWLWRQVPTSAALAALRSGAARLLAPDESPDPSRGRVMRAAGTGMLATYWEFVSSQIANAFPSYSLVASTTADSTPSSNPTTLFMVEARGSGHVAWDAVPMPGYSVDNLPPPAPVPFLASYAAGVTSLHWSPPGAPDLASYRLYRGSSAGFTPSPGNRIGTPTDTTFADSPGGFYYYKVSAVDVHGNEGPASLAFPTGTTGVVADTPRELALEGVAPNPARTGALVHWALPRAASVRLTVLDLAGRRVRTLLDGEQPAGRHLDRWDARDDSGRPVASGVYFVSLEAEGRALRARMAVIR